MAEEGWNEEAVVDEPIVQKFATEVKLFGKWSYFDLHIADETLRDYISVVQTKSKIFLPHTAGRWQQKKFRKGACPLIERLVTSLMQHGRNTGKKMMAVRMVKQALEIIHLLIGENPIQVFINAVCNAGPREDSSRIGGGGVVRRTAVDVSPLRRVNQGIYLICCGARDNAFRNLQTFPECLAAEIINAAKGAAGSYAVRKKDEIERIAKGNR